MRQENKRRLHAFFVLTIGQFANIVRNMPKTTPLSERLALFETPAVGVTVHLPDYDAELLEQYVALRNAYAKARGQTLRRKVNRKAILEHFTATECEKLRRDLDDMIAALGAMPAAEDEAAMLAYAKRAVAKGVKI